MGEYVQGRNEEREEERKEWRRVQRIKCIHFAHTERDSPMMAKMRV